MTVTPITQQQEPSHLSRIITDMEKAMDLLRQMDEAGIDTTIYSVNVYLHQFSAAELAKIARCMGKARKESSGDTFWIKRQFGSVDVTAFPKSREEVCERVVVGTRDIPERVEPARTEEIVEWRCRPLLAADEEV